MLQGVLFRTNGWAGRGLGLVLGALAVLGHAPFHLWPIALISLACLFARLEWASQADRPGRAGFSVALWWGLGYFAAGTFWIGSAFIERGPEFIPIMPFMVGGLALLLAIFWGLAGAFLARFKVSGLWAVMGFTAAFLLAELTRGHILAAFRGTCPHIYLKLAPAPHKLRGGLEPMASRRWFYL